MKRTGKRPGRTEPGKDVRFAISLIFPDKPACRDKTIMNVQIVKWCVDLAMGIVFMISIVTVLFKFILLMRTLGLTNLVLPLTRMSDLQDWVGIILCVLIVVHMFMNRRWFLSMTRKILNGTLDAE